MEEPDSNTYPISGYFRRPSSVDFLFMQISKVAVPIVAALAVTAGGVVAALVPAIGCMLMIWLMMRMMDHGSQH